MEASDSLLPRRGRAAFKWPRRTKLIHPPACGRVGRAAAGEGLHGRRVKCPSQPCSPSPALRADSPKGRVKWGGRSSRGRRAHGNQCGVFIVATRPAAARYDTRNDINTCTPIHPPVGRVERSEGRGEHNHGKPHARRTTTAREPNEIRGIAVECPSRKAALWTQVPSPASDRALYCRLCLRQQKTGN